ncbi:hypothetical protein OHB56_25110 [Streptomyces sp. NBC_01635]|uniref:hypothetical protein n=1 Tax=Streptomyces sp. NBC_01635 TaxID=2975904 RepID=UPI003862ED8F|nr:hypothetical protein OHB56_25110 [Streptomyces sp. NBC_01635]
MAAGPLQSWLLAEKRRSGLSFGQLAALTFVSKSSLQRATRGFELPSRQVFEAFISGCASDPEIAEREWRTAMAMRRYFLGRRMYPIRPENVTSHSELRQALEDLIDRRGLSLRQIEKLTEKRNGKLRRSTLSDALSGRQNFSRVSVAELVRSCGEKEDLAHAWDEAWQRAERDRRGRKGHLGEFRALPAEVRQYVELGVGEIYSVCERHGVSSAEIEMYMRQCAELRRRTGISHYWINAPESWKESVSRPCGDVSGGIERAIQGVLMETFGGPVDGGLLGGLTKAVLKEIGQSRVADDVEASESVE